jgi:acyl-coenzyme A thioesterase 13
MGTLALLANDPARGGVSIEMNMSFLAPIKVGDIVLAEGEMIKTGKSLGFTEVRLYRKSDGKQIAIGRHTKAF